MAHTPELCIYCGHISKQTHEAKTKKDRSKWKCAHHGIEVGVTDCSCSDWCMRSNPDLDRLLNIPEIEVLQ